MAISVRITAGLPVAKNAGQSASAISVRKASDGHIEGLKKPSTWWTVEEAFGGDGYQLWRHDDSGGIVMSRGDVQITTAQADALYEYMRREHGED